MGLTTIYVIATIGYVLISRQTLKQIARQVESSHDHGIEMSRQREAMNRQWHAMREQDITLREQLEEMMRLTAATVDAATAAKRSADLLVNIERAWIEVRVPSLAEFTPVHRESFVWFRPHVSNTGKTPATVIGMVVKADILEPQITLPAEVPPQLPEEPDYSGGISFVHPFTLSPKSPGIGPPAGIGHG